MDYPTNPTPTFTSTAPEVGTPNTHANYGKWHHTQPTSLQNSVLNSIFKPSMTPNTDSNAYPITTNNVTNDPTPFPAQTQPAPQHSKRTHACPYPSCDRVFTCPHNVQQHIREKHTHERPHRCHLCGTGADEKAFTRPYGLNRHMLAVHGVKGKVVAGVGWVDELPPGAERGPGMGLREFIEAQKAKKQLEYIGEVGVGGEQNVGAGVVGVEHTGQGVASGVSQARDEVEFADMRTALTGWLSQNSGGEESEAQADGGAFDMNVSGNGGAETSDSVQYHFDFDWIENQGPAQSQAIPAPAHESNVDLDAILAAQNNPVIDPVLLQYNDSYTATQLEQDVENFLSDSGPFAANQSTEAGANAFNTQIPTPQSATSKLQPILSAGPGLDHQHRHDGKSYICGECAAPCASMDDVLAHLHAAHGVGVSPSCPCLDCTHAFGDDAEEGAANVDGLGLTGGASGAVAMLEKAAEGMQGAMNADLFDGFEAEDERMEDVDQDFLELFGEGPC